MASKPNGGFPPIYECKFDKDIAENAEKNLNKIREFSQIKKTISVRDIMKMKQENISKDLINS